MVIKNNKETAIVSTDICNINNKEMRQMHELKKRIDDVLISHKPDSKEKKHISDDDLKREVIRWPGRVRVLNIPVEY